MYDRLVLSCTVSQTFWWWEPELQSWPKSSRPNRDETLMLQRRDFEKKVEMRPRRDFWNQMLTNCYEVFFNIKFSTMDISEHLAILDWNFRVFWIAFGIFGCWNSSIGEIKNTVETSPFLEFKVPRQDQNFRPSRPKLWILVSQGRDVSRHYSSGKNHSTIKLCGPWI